MVPSRASPPCKLSPRPDQEAAQYDSTMLRPLTMRPVPHEEELQGLVTYYLLTGHRAEHFVVCP